MRSRNGLALAAILAAAVPNLQASDRWKIPGYDNFRDAECAEFQDYTSEEQIVKGLRKLKGERRLTHECMAEAWTNRGRLAYQNGKDLEKMLTYANKSLGLADNAGALQLVGLYHFEKKEYRLAEPKLRSSLEVNEGWQAHAMLGKLLYFTKRPEEALKHFLRANEIHTTEDTKGWISGIMGQYANLKNKYSRSLSLD